MIDDKRVLCIIPARGGSKRLPRKNVLPLAGKPLIHYSVAAAMASEHFDRVIVSTDDTEIADRARESGADVPFVRPAELATDTATAVDVLIHAVDFFEQTGDQYDFVVLIQPTTPLVQANDIDQAIQTIINTGTRSCVSVCKVSERPEWMYSLDGDMATPFFESENSASRQQDLSELFRLNGAVYVLKRDLLNQRLIVDQKSLSAIVMPKDRSIDIDEQIDFTIAETILQSRMS